MSNDKATPRPWAWEWCGVDAIITKGDSVPPNIGFLFGDTPEMHEAAAANAALIVRAVNSHDALVAALHDLREWVRNPGPDDGAANDAIILAADAALALAKGE